MTLPLLVLALCTIVLSLLLTPAWPWLHDYLSGRSADFDLARLIQPMLFVSLALVAVGIASGILIYRNVQEIDPVQRAQPALFGFLANRMWLDEFYAHTIIAASATGARLADWMDHYVWDGLVRMLASLGHLLGLLSQSSDERAINAGVDRTTTHTRNLGRWGSGIHSGQIQNYLGAVGIGMLALLLLYAWLG